MTTGSVIAGVMSEKYGWRSFWWLDCALYCFMFVWSIFLMPETKWTRDPKPTMPTEGSSTSSLPNEEAEKEVVTIIEDNHKETILVNDYLYKGKPQKKQFGIFHDETGEPVWKIWRAFWIPVKICSLPIVLWSSLVYSGNASLFLVVNLTQSSAFTPAPYNFSASAVGYTNFATLGGLIIGLFTAGHFSDWICSWSTKRNNGIREPEMRLPSLIPFAILATVATVILCVGYDNQWDWPIIVILGYGLIGM